MLFEGGEIQLTSSHEPGDIFNVGNTEVIYSATDENSGFEKECKFNVIIQAQGLEEFFGYTCT